MKQNSKLRISGKNLAEASPLLCSKIGGYRKPHEPVFSELTGPFFSGSVEVHHPAPGLYLYILDLHVKKNIELAVTMDQPMVVFSTILSGYCRQRIQQPGRREATIEFNAGKNVFCTFQDGKSRFDLAGSQTHRIVDLQIDPLKARELGDFTKSGLSEPLYGILARSSGAGVNRQAPLNLNLENTARQILQCRLRGVARNIYMQAKSLEILALELDSLESKGRRYDSSKTEMKQLEMARHILHAEYSAPPSLVQLARRIGLNDFKLKRGFRDAYDTTVFGYVRRLRMEKAWEMLKTGEPNVGEVALAVGYQCFGHFSAAFKKHFGVLPSAVRLDR